MVSVAGTCSLLSTLIGAKPNRFFNIKNAATPPTIAMGSIRVISGSGLLNRVLVCNAELVNDTITAPYKLFAKCKPSARSKPSSSMVIKPSKSPKPI